MSKTTTSVLGSWPQDIPSQTPILTISDTVELPQTEKYIKTEGEHRFAYSLIGACVAAAIVSFVTTKYFLTYQDGLVRSGYIPQAMVQNGVTVEVLIPVYLQQKDRALILGGHK